MKVRPRLVLDAERIETEEQARRVTMPPNELGPMGWAEFIGDWIIAGPHGTFIVCASDFEDRYEVV